jgi:hypothetical protein
MWLVNHSKIDNDSSGRHGDALSQIDDSSAAPPSHSRLFTAQDPRVEVAIFGGHMNSHPVGQVILHRLLSSLDPTKVRITLIATPLKPDDVTKTIAAVVHDIINLPFSTSAAWTLIEKLNLDVIIFPDWQPFPDQQSILFQTRRMAPVQICLYTRGSSCASNAIDYYILPSELRDFYFEQLYSTTVFPSLQAYVEQVVLVDFPIFTPKAIRAVSKFAVEEEDETSSGIEKEKKLKEKNNEYRQESSRSTFSFTSSSSSSSSSSASSSDPASGSAAEQKTTFMPSEIEGRIFFEGQPVAVLALHPTYIHPLMDEIIFQIMNLSPSLQVLITFFLSFFFYSFMLFYHKLSTFLYSYI